jgi:C-terminal processing protease CtpA/Prc
MSRSRTMRRTFAFVILMAAGLQAQDNAAAISPGRAKAMLRDVREAIERYYYDPTFGGRTLDELFKSAEQRLATARTTSDVFSALALPLMDLEDSHTRFLPPPRATTVAYGVDFAPVGDRVLVVAVTPGSDAANQGIRVGDEALRINTIEATRRDLWKLNYVLTVLRPQPALVMRIRADGVERDVTAKARAIKRPRVIDLTSEFTFHELELEADAIRALLMIRHHAIDDKILIARLPAFTAETSDIDAMVRRARNFKTLILDLRGNGGGAVVGLERLASLFFATPVPLAKIVERKRTRELMSKPPRQGFMGDLIVLTDSRSASASEMFARVVQIQRRGTVIGDRTAGAVMQSILVPYTSGLGEIMIYGVSVTNADVVMSDGSRLERVGVTPDQVLIPTSEDLRLGRDVVLASAVARAGGSMTPEEAGALFPTGPKKN